MRHVEDARVIAGGTRPEDVRAAFTAVRALLAGSGAPLAPRDPRTMPPGGHDVGSSAAVPVGTAVVLPTSGSSGPPRLVVLGLEALQAAAQASHERLGGPGRWLLALPIHHIAGWQVLVRAAVTGPTPPAILDTTDGFDPSRLAAAAAASAPRYTSLVPTQLVRVLADPEATRALRPLEAILLGGAAAPGGLIERARRAGLNVVATYGMTETGGGCVYDGVPLAGVQVTAVEGRLEIAGPVLAAGYLAPGGPGSRDGGAPTDPTAAANGSTSGEGSATTAGSGGPTRGEQRAIGSPEGPDGGGFVLRGGRRWLRTPDLGSIDDRGRVHVLGRADDVIVTGGLKVHPGPVERALLEAGSVAEAVVVGLPDAEWGLAVTAVVVPAAGRPVPDLSTLRNQVAARIGRSSAPRSLVVVPDLPLIGPGKVDRAGAARLAADILAGARPQDR